MQSLSCVNYADSILKAGIQVSVVVNTSLAKASKLQLPPTAQIQQPQMSPLFRPLTTLLRSQRPDEQSLLTIYSLSFWLHLLHTHKHKLEAPKSQTRMDNGYFNVVRV